MSFTLDIPGSFGHSVLQATADDSDPPIKDITKPEFVERCEHDAGSVYDGLVLDWKAMRDFHYAKIAQLEAQYRAPNSAEEPDAKSLKRCQERNEELSVHIASLQAEHQQREDIVLQQEAKITAYREALGITTEKAPASAHYHPATPVHSPPSNIAYLPRSDNIADASYQAPAKPIAFTGDKFNGKPDDLLRFLRHLERDFLLYGGSFPTDAHRVAYATSGFTAGPEVWVSQYSHQSPDGVLHNWETFRAALEAHFADPDLVSNKSDELLQLRQEGSLLDFTSQFESLATLVNWPRANWASTYLHALRPGLATPIRRSDVNLTDYVDVKRKAFRLDRSTTSPAQRVIPPARQPRNFANRDRYPRDPARITNVSDRKHSMADLNCYNCQEKGHISRNCPIQKQQVELKNVEEEMDELEAKNCFP